MDAKSDLTAESHELGSGDRMPVLASGGVAAVWLDREDRIREATASAAGMLGFEPQAFQEFARAIASPYGMVLVTGPTGSGKTTTLYSALTRINTPEVNVMTAEDLEMDQVRTLRGERVVRQPGQPRGVGHHHTVAFDDQSLNKFLPFG